MIEISKNWCRERCSKLIKGQCKNINGKITHIKCSKNFNCPNCESGMKFEEQIQFGNYTYDKWGCPQCPLLVLDWRGN
jgi:hypothetical protein